MQGGVGQGPDFLWIGHISENPYMQYFIGYKEFRDEKPVDFYAGSEPLFGVESPIAALSGSGKRCEFTFSVFFGST